MNALAETAPPRPLVEGPSAWYGPDLAHCPEQWTYHLSPADIAEVEAATAAVRARSLDIADIGRADFLLPALGATLDRLRNDVRIEDYVCGEKHRDISPVRGVQVR